MKPRGASRDSPQGLILCKWDSSSSALLGDLSLEQVLPAFAHDEGFSCVELMCWPPGGFRPPLCRRHPS